MSDFYIITDATIDLSGEVVEELGVKVIPMAFSLGNDEYRHYPDARELSYDEFYTRLKNGEDASTSQISPIIYEEFFEPFLKEGKDIIYVCLSSGLSGTYNVSQLVARELMEQYPGRRIEAIDSLDASIGEGLLILLAARKMQAGASFEEVVEFIKDTRLKVEHCFMVEDLAQLKRGGRISSIEAVIGSALQIHPILTMNAEGRLEVIQKVRGVKKSIHYLRDYCAEKGEDLSEATVILGHASCPEYVEFLANEVKSNNLCKECVISQIGPVIGSHVGKGMCAITFISKEARK